MLLYRTQFIDGEQKKCTDIMPAFFLPHTYFIKNIVQHNKKMKYYHIQNKIPLFTHARTESHFKFKSNV